MTGRRLSKEESRKRFSELRELWREWDPIGVMDFPEPPLDEYDNYVGKSMRLLEANASDDEFTEYLEYIVVEYIGLGENGIEHSKPGRFVKVMQAWFIKNWKDTYV